MAGTPQVTIKQGALWGKTMTSKSGREFCAFQGIPYAKPPVGELRFKPPEEPNMWVGPRMAKQEGPKCCQVDFITNEIYGEEDCLYLNVYTPTVEKKKDSAGLSVMVWIHGGAFFAGSGSTELYGPDLLLDHDIVLVTINYRLGALGFLSLGTSSAPGNYGLKDQVAALRWVNKNIAKFGGNPASVTIFGESAGGASVHYLMLSPLARGLFHRAIAQSGSAHNDWALQRDVSTRAREFAFRLGCHQPDPAALTSCLRGVPAKQLIEMELTLRSEARSLTYFAPCLEPADTKGAFLTEDPRILLARGDISDVPFMTGYTTHEGMLTLGMLQAQGRNIDDDIRENSARYVPHELDLKMSSSDFQVVQREINNFYQQLEPEDHIERFILLNTDVDFVKGVDELARGVAALRKSPVFYYQFSYDGALALIKKIYQIERKGTAHADELGYILSRTMISDELSHASKSDHVTIERMTKLWTNFAKTGNPTPDSSLGVRWDQVVAPLHGSNMADTKYLDIGENLVMNNKIINAQRVRFWQNLIQAYKKKYSKL